MMYTKKCSIFFNNVRLLLKRNISPYTAPTVTDLFPKKVDLLNQIIDNKSTISNPPQRKLFETLLQIPQTKKKLELLAAEDEILYKDDLDAVNEYGGLFLRQLQSEEKQNIDAVQEYLDSVQNLVKMNQATNMKYVQRLIAKWFNPLNEAIKDATKTEKFKQNRPDHTNYIPYLLVLPAEKLTAITLSRVVSSCLKCVDGAKVVELAKEIGDLIEAEVHVNKFKRGKKGIKRWEKELLDQCTGHKYKSFSNKIRQIIKEEKWQESDKVKIGDALITFLIESAKLDDGNPVFTHKTPFCPTVRKRKGLLEMNKELLQNLTKSNIALSPIYLPMLVPSKKWNNQRNIGGYFRLRPGLVKTRSKAQIEAIKMADIPKITKALDYLGRISWKINVNMLKIIKTIWENNESIGEIPSQTDIPMPSEDDFLKEIEHDVNFKQFVKNQSTLEIDQTENLRKSNLYAKKLYSRMCNKVKQKNNDLHSLRIDFKLKISIAEKFTDDKMYFPCNLDFRGRAYPVPPNLNYLGSDLCRSLLYFDKPKELGQEGFDWLKIHLCNLFGNNKITLKDRIEWTESQLDMIKDSALHPLDGLKWWATAENPYQALATCIEINNAIESGDPLSYKCRLPIHQDGSCNGLQHYAALGRDEPGAYSVNLIPSDRPQDVYGAVLEKVIDKLKLDAKESENENQNENENKESVNTDETKSKHKDYAKFLLKMVSRKVIKQTVMTSVYGVTKIGARDQVRARVMELVFPEKSSQITDDVLENLVYHSSAYLADITLESLAEMFSSANEIMEWLSLCASLVAQNGQPMSWITPLGLPVIQPYRKAQAYVVKTLLQDITLSLDDESLPVLRKKQSSAFPPNFVHSLDSTHMIMTSLKAESAKITFAAVHDSFWTHAGDIPILNKALRETFVELYSKPLLESLRNSLMIRYPEVDFPEVPKRGNLDISKVLKSEYFFH